ncbi:hypothetical protein QBC47DRAFT_409787 [Echria macrotheca]|uniref:Uncharacterized protein n=1 Tax=Echria macrotheca TaxID=438768 RepID=A0AAJ0BJ94_9PEZI|nr:hypothetical protein QBC47DRAFT_409787 [Echria macrotheca]
METEATTSEVPAVTAYLGLLLCVLAVLTLQPDGHILGFHPSLRIYILSQPILCGVAAFWRFLRVAHFLRNQARWEDFSWENLISATGRGFRNLVTIKHQDPPPEPGRQAWGLSPFWRAVVNLLLFLLATVWGPIKTFTATGLLWTTVWTAYTAYYVVTKLGDFVGQNRAENRPAPPLAPNAPRDPVWIDKCENYSKYVAVPLQLAVFSCVDLRPIHPDKDILKRYEFRFYRLFAHLVSYLIYIYLEQQARDRLHQRFRRRVLAPIPWLFLLVILGYFVFTQNTFTLLYIFVTASIPLVVWILSNIEGNDVRKNLGLVEVPGEHSLLQGFFAFDLFLRLLFFSIYGYVVHYHPEETAKAPWLEWLP